jgi:ABC-type glycerol-3-phosphate transport system permease component
MDPGRSALSSRQRHPAASSICRSLYAQQMALALLGALPLLVVFLLFQRQIVQGIANTGLKG